MTRVLARACRSEVAALSADIQKSFTPIIIKEPAKTLVMIKIRDPVKQGSFFIGETIACEAVVEIDGKKGVSVLIGDDAEKTLDIAIIDAAINKGVFNGMDTLLTLERKQMNDLMRENGLHLKTMVNFESMDQEAPNDLNAYKKT
jgi:alpha-D-ribose 1-methylphosphonate 5-triphosphate synthase subunit PhnG